MKPRLDVAPKTPEDRAIWLRMANRYIRQPGAFGVTSYVYRDADRRDADLMYGLEWCRAQERRETVDGEPLTSQAYAHCLLEAHGLIGGADPFEAFDITNFA